MTSTGSFSRGACKSLPWDTQRLLHRLLHHRISGVKFSCFKGYICVWLFEGCQCCTFEIMDLNAYVISEQRVKSSSS